MLYVYNFNVTVKLYLHVLDYTTVAVSWKVGPVNSVNHKSWVTVVTQTDCPKSVRNSCLIELFCGVVCVVTLPFLHFCWCRGFCYRTESDLFLFLSTRNSSILMMSSSVYSMERHFDIYSIIWIYLQIFEDIFKWIKDIFKSFEDIFNSFEDIFK